MHVRDVLLRMRVRARIAPLAYAPATLICDWYGTQEAGGIDDLHQQQQALVAPSDSAGVVLIADRNSSPTDVMVAFDVAVTSADA